MSHRNFPDDFCQNCPNFVPQGHHRILPNLQNRDGHGIRLYRLPSSSRAYPLPFDKKVEAYRKMFSEVGLITTRA